ncbi:MAG: hypothetical protein ACI9SQ_001778 [Rubritalea sp.]|jgi:hypothetical protein
MRLDMIEDFNDSLIYGNPIGDMKTTKLRQSH